jgi:hypothetical protein
MENACAGSPRTPPGVASLSISATAGSRRADQKTRVRLDFFAMKSNISIRFRYLPGDWPLSVPS